MLYEDLDVLKILIETSFDTIIEQFLKKETPEEEEEKVTISLVFEAEEVGQ